MPGDQPKKHRKATPRPHDAPGGRKATAEEVQARVEWCADLMVPGMKTVTEIHKAFRDKFKIHWGTVDQVYIPRARALLRRRSTMTPAQARDIVVGVLLSTIRKGKNGDRRAAVAQLRDLYGLDKPKRMALGLAPGAPADQPAAPADASGPPDGLSLEQALAGLTVAELEAVLAGGRTLELPPGAVQVGPANGENKTES